jgi:hypothetical protein
VKKLLEQAQELMIAKGFVARGNETLQSRRTDDELFRLVGNKRSNYTVGLTMAIELYWGSGSLSARLPAALETIGPFQYYDSKKSNEKW